MTSLVQVKEKRRDFAIQLAKIIDNDPECPLDSCVIDPNLYSYIERLSEHDTAPRV